jgi:hypothetical protein
MGHLQSGHHWRHTGYAVIGKCVFSKPIRVMRVILLDGKASASSRGGPSPYHALFFYASLCFSPHVLSFDLMFVTPIDIVPNAREPRKVELLSIKSIYHEKTRSPTKGDMLYVVYEDKVEEVGHRTSISLSVLVSLSLSRSPSPSLSLFPMSRAYRRGSYPCTHVTC